MKSGWHFVGKDKNPAGRHKKAEHFSEGTVLTQNKFMMKTIVVIFNQIFRDKCTRANDMPRMLCGISRAKAIFDQNNIISIWLSP